MRFNFPLSHQAVFWIYIFRFASLAILNNPVLKVQLAACGSGPLHRFFPSNLLYLSLGKTGMEVQAANTVQTARILPLQLPENDREC